MAPVAPPIGPHPGSERPLICLSHADHTCPNRWLHKLAACLERAFGTDVSINVPFTGGHIIRAHCRELPWLQLEVNRAPFLSNGEKRDAVLEALDGFCASVL